MEFQLWKREVEHGGVTNAERSGDVNRQTSPQREIRMRMGHMSKSSGRTRGNRVGTLNQDFGGGVMAGSGVSV